ncbi:hypothetical protein [Rhizobium laguerreae]|uniref:hypothetical protein n=1 Tax=Rhizobium laguerreae TaxID=1076926 RepID=UPI00103AB5E4|nr:hypothetical protein [Rhizobium laguerreae]TBX98343.1 hypothetical protein E0J21_35085 [Rhizobium laguerreae]
MRYLHSDVKAIRMFAEENQLSLTRIEPTTSPALRIIDYASIDEMLEASQKLWGLTLPFYVMASKKKVKDFYSLKDAVTTLEAAPKSDDFILVAYQDGGIISISNNILPFQPDAAKASWWTPTV